MYKHNFNLKSSAMSLAGALMLAFSATVHADLINGIVDVWIVDVSTIFDTTTIVDSNGNTPGGVTAVTNQRLRWGIDLGSGQSGLDITGSPSIQNVATNGAAVPNVSVTHLNNPIQAPTLRSVDILSTLTLTPFSPSGGVLPSSTVTFGVDFLETSNGANPCADGGANGVGVNSNGCADIFVIDQNSLNFPFFYDLDALDGNATDDYAPQQYFISFFEATSGLNPLPAAACASVGVASPCLGFRTPEGSNTTFQFAALITTERVSVVPEPGALALMGLGFGLMGLLRRRRTA
jgi:hypothetical protein